MPDGPRHRAHDLRPGRLRRVRGLIVAGFADGALELTIAFIAIAFGTINIVGGFLVTDRMLGMFVRKPRKEDES